MSDAPGAPSPDLFFEAASAYQRTEALRTAVELELFTAMAAGRQTAAELARACAASEKGMAVTVRFTVPSPAGSSVPILLYAYLIAVALWTLAR